MSKGDNYMDPADQEALERTQAALKKRQQDREQSDIKWLMGHEQGRRVMARLFDSAGIFRTTFRPNSEMPFLEGMRNMGLIFYADVIELAPEQYIQMLSEQKELKEHERASN